MTHTPFIDLNNTEHAFAYKTDAELAHAQLVFRMINTPILKSIGPKIARSLFQAGFPLDFAFKSTLFRQFCGGTTIEECTQVMAKLTAYNVTVALDYAAEGHGHKAEQGFKDLIMLMSKHPAPLGAKRFFVVKPSMLVLEEVATKVSSQTPLNQSEERQWQTFRTYMFDLAAKAKEQQLDLLVDAEESWTQPAIDQLVDELMATFNKDKAVVYQTIQMYRVNRLPYLKQLIDTAKERHHFVGVKIVRGAYMEKERERARRLCYPSPIHATKQDCDRDFDSACALAIANLDRVFLFMGTHNKQSVLKAAQAMDQAGHPYAHPHLVISQLYGMGDDISFNLAKAGFTVAKYLPFGPLKIAIPYMLRRAEENTAVAGETSRELALITKEILRRKK